MHHLTGAQPPPPPELRFRRRIDLVGSARELWRARRLVLTLAERTLRVRYKQAVLGAAWAIVTPLALTVVFTLFVTRVANIDTGGAPYPIFAFLGLLPWSFFSTSVSAGAMSLVDNRSLLRRVYCPREVFPTSAIVVAGDDSLVSLGALLALFGAYTRMPQPESVWLPVLFGIQLAFTAGVTLLLSSLLVYLRDVRHALPLLLQLGIFATPVAYGLDAIPSSMRSAYAVFNPLGPVIEGYRDTVLAGVAPDAHLLTLAAVASLGYFLVGYLTFKRLEPGFADHV